MSYLLDSNVWISLIRQTSSQIEDRFRAVAASGDIRICSVVLAELLYGSEHSAKPAANRLAVCTITAPFLMLPFDAAAAEQYATIRFQLESMGRVIGPYDLQIAAIALANNCTLVTHNVKEFARVPGLSVDDWQV